MTKEKAFILSMVIISIGMITVGAFSYSQMGIDHKLKINTFYNKALKLKIECEKDLARSKRCILEYKFVVDND